MRREWPRRGEALDPALEAFLTDYFGRDVSAVRLCSGSISRWLTRLFRASAMVLGQSILFSPKGWQHYRSRTIFGIALTAHEVRHTLQYRDLGFLGFFWAYLVQAVKAAGDPKKMPLEIEGYEVHAEVEERLRARPVLLAEIRDSAYGAEPTSSARLDDAT